MYRAIAIGILCGALSGCISMEAISQMQYELWDNISFEARTLLEKRQYDRAEAIAKEALALAEKSREPHDPIVARSLNTLAAAYQGQKRYALAEPLYRRSLTIVEKALGPDDPAVATGLNYLAELLRLTGRGAEAEPLQQRSLATFEKAHGPQHSAVATSLKGLALLHHEKGEYAEAERLYERSRAIFEASLLADHPDLTTSAPLKSAGPRPRRGLTNLDALAEVEENLAAVYRRTDRVRQADVLGARAARTREIRRQAALPPVIEVTSSDVTINGVTVTPGLFREPFLKALGEQARFHRGISDSYKYPALGLTFGVNRDTHLVHSFVLQVVPAVVDGPYLRQFRIVPDQPFEGSFVLFGKELPLSATVREIAQIAPELGLGLNAEYLTPAMASRLGEYAADIGAWRLSVGADAETLAVKSVRLSFTGGIVCRDDQQTQCFERATGKWRGSTVPIPTPWSPPSPPTMDR